MHAIATHGPAIIIQSWYIAIAASHNNILIARWTIKECKTYCGASLSEDIAIVTQSWHEAIECVYI